MAKLEKYLLSAITLLTLAVYLPALWCGFVDFDDPGMVLNNPYIRAGLTFEGVRWAFTTGYMANWIPLSWISHMVDVQLFGMNPVAHHAGNVVLHTANVALLFVFLKKTTSAPWRSAFVAVLFALHPMHVESVVWVSERKDVLSGFFWMATLLAYHSYRKKIGLFRYIGVLAMFALGLLAKPMMVTLPVILLLLDWWPLGRTTDRSEYPHTTPLLLIAEKVPLLLLSLTSSVITYWAQAVDGVNYQGYTVAARVGRACVSYLSYLWMTVWPIDLAVIYPFSKYPPTQFKILASQFTLLLLTAVAIWLRKRFQYLLVGWGWYLTSLLPVIGLIQIGQHSVADRYTYLPHIGLFMLIVWGSWDLCERWSVQRRVVAGVSAVVLVALTTLTVIQISYWKNSFALFSRAVAVTQGNWVAHHNLGRVLQDQGKIDESIVQFTAAIKAKPSYALAFLGIGVAFHKKGEYTLSVNAFKSALMFEPAMLEARLGLGLVYSDMGEQEKALQEYQILNDFGSPYAEELRAYLSTSPSLKK